MFLAGYQRYSIKHRPVKSDLARKAGKRILRALNLVPDHLAVQNGNINARLSSAQRQLLDNARSRTRRVFGTQQGQQ